MKIALNKWFSLPFLRRETFADLMKARVQHDKKFGFKFTSSTNVPRALSVLSSALGEPVEMAKSCFICENPLDDEVDDEEEVQAFEGQRDRTICSECMRNDDAYDLYMMNFAKLMETL